MLLMAEGDTEADAYALGMEKGSTCLSLSCMQ